MYGADDFLPMLTYVVAQCDMPQLDTEIQYMMELLDPSLLQGEGMSCYVRLLQYKTKFKKKPPKTSEYNIVKCGH